MGIDYLNLSSFGQFRQKKDEKSTAKFHYIKTVSGKVVAQSVAFRVASIWGRPLPPEILAESLKLTHPRLKAASFDTFCFVAPQP